MCVAILEVLSHVAVVNLSDFLIQSHPLQNHGRPGIHGNTLSQHRNGTHSWQEGMNEIACAPHQPRRGGPSNDEGYELTYFSYLPSNEPSNLQTPFLRYRDGDDDETVIICSRICNPMQSNAVYAAVKGVRLSPFFFLNFNGEYMREAAKCSRKRGSSISFLFLNEAYCDDINTSR